MGSHVLKTQVATCSLKFPSLVLLLSFISLYEYFICFICFLFCAFAYSRLLVQTSRLLHILFLGAVISLLMNFFIPQDKAELPADSMLTHEHLQKIPLDECHVLHSIHITGVDSLIAYLRRNEFLALKKFSNKFKFKLSMHYKY